MNPISTFRNYTKKEFLFYDPNHGFFIGFFDTGYGISKKDVPRCSNLNPTLWLPLPTPTPTLTEELDDETFLVGSTSPPRFCVSGATREEALEKAQRAVEYYTAKHKVV